MAALGEDRRDEAAEAARIVATSSALGHAAATASRSVRLLLRSRGGLAGLVILVFFTAVAVLGPLLAPHDPNAVSDRIMESPSRDYWLGTDDNGRDLLSQLIIGTQISMFVGFSAALVSAVIGAVVGISAGYFGGWTDRLLTALDDWFLVIPFIPVVVLMAALLGQKANSFPLGQASVLVVAIGAFGWAGTSRIVRSEVLSLKERTFVERARALGASDAWIMRKHILPNVLPLIFANTVLFVAISILTESSLSFLGLGDPTHLSWGQILNAANEAGAQSVGAWWYFVPPGVCITVVVLAFSLVGYAIEEIVNPKLRERS